MATVHFTSTDVKVFTPISTALSNLPNGAATIVVLLKQTAANVQDLCGLMNASSTNWYHGLVISNIGTALGDDDGTSVVTGSTAQTDATSWWMFAVDWPSGGAALERFHFRNQSTLGSWTHENSSGNNAGNRAGPGTSAFWRIGYIFDFSSGARDVGVVAVWAGTRFADANYGTWTKTSDLAQHPLGPPTFLCELTAATLVDLMGGSTYSSANSSGTALTGGNPPNWTMDGLGSGGLVYQPRRMPLGV